MSDAKPVALVTGAAGGIGRPIAERFLADRFDVLSVDLDAGDGLPGSPLSVDLTTRQGNEAAVSAAIDRFGRLDVVVPCAGAQHVESIENFPEQRWDFLLALLLSSPFLLAKHAWPHLRESPLARFIAIASIHGLVASPYKAGYVAAKHGLVGLVKTLALEGAEDGILATAVCPGFVRTPLVEGQIAAQAAAHGISEEEVLSEVVLGPHAVKRMIEPSEIAELVAFLVGPGGRSFTGTAVTMDLGWSAR